MRRIPLWATLLPLAIGIGAYWFLWSGWARGFEAALRPWLPGAAISATGFPYRLEAEVANPRLSHGDTVKLAASADLVRINRGPWRPELTIISALMPDFSAAVSPLLSASSRGREAQISVKTEDGRLARLSAVVTIATARLGFVPVAITADSLELHLREPPPTAAPPRARAAVSDLRASAAAPDLRASAAAPDLRASAPTPAPRGQVVIGGERLRLAGGDALTMAGDITVTGPARLTGYDNWAASGTLELTRFSLADAHGDVAAASATLVPRGRSGLRFAGTVTTVCPASVVAAFKGLAAPPERRLRLPVRLAFSGVPGAVLLEGLPANLATRPVKAQLPPCPVIRGRG